LKLVSTFRETQLPQKWRAAFAESEVVSSGNAIGTGSFGVVKDAISRTYGPVAIKTQTFTCKDKAVLLGKLGRFISELSLNMLTNDQSVIVKCYGGDIVVDDTEKIVRCLIMMKREKCTLNSYLKQARTIPLLKALEIALGLLRIARALRRMEFSHSDIKLDNILCSVTGTDLCLTDLGQASSWASRYGSDVMVDGFHTERTVPWRARYPHCSTKNNTCMADETVDQFSVALLILQLTLGKTHPIAQVAVSTKKVGDHRWCTRLLMFLICVRYYFLFAYRWIWTYASAGNISLPLWKHSLSRLRDF
jgi:serine/threonine protein kinase